MTNIHDKQKDPEEQGELVGLYCSADLSFGYIYLLFNIKRLRKSVSVSVRAVIYLLKKLIVFMCVHSYV